MAIVHYRVYKPRGAVKSKNPFDSANPWVGRINVDTIPPPHTVASIMRCISKSEDMDHCKYTQLWESSESDEPLKDGHISILTSERPGSTPDIPIAFVESNPASSSSLLFDNDNPRKLRVTSVSGELRLSHEESCCSHLLSSAQQTKSRLVESQDR
jgi:hypothetical protein